MDEVVLHAPWFLGLVFVSGLAGAVGSLLVYLALRRLAGAAAPVFCREFVYSGLLMGVVERLFFTLAIGWVGDAGIVPAAIGWVAIKGQVHYKMFSEKGQEDLSRAYLGLMASLASLLFALAGGYVWREGISVSSVIACLAG